MEYYEASKFFFLTLLKILLLKVYLHALPMCTKDFLQMFIVKCSFPTNEVILIVQPTLENKFIKKKKNWHIFQLQWRHWQCNDTAIASILTL